MIVDRYAASHKFIAGSSSLRRYLPGVVEMRIHPNRSIFRQHLAEFIVYPLWQDHRKPDARRLYGSVLPTDNPDTEEWEGAFDDPDTPEDEEWSKLKKCRYIQRSLWIRDVKRWERKSATETYVDTISEDEGLVSPVAE